MRIKWLGHAAFLITAEDGTRIITDPFGKFPDLNYKPIKETAEIVVVSHQHGDHIGGEVKGNPQTVSEVGTRKVKGIEFKGVASFHDPSGGSQRGTNTIFCFTVDRVKVCHLGDLGHLLSEKQIAEIGEVDVLLIPVGGFYTIDAQEATQVCAQLNPKVIIPMHYKNEKCNFPISGVEDFLQNKSNVKRLDTSEIEIKKAELPASTEILVLQPAL